MSLAVLLLAQALGVGNGLTFAGVNGQTLVAAYAKLTNGAACDGPGGIIDVPAGVHEIDQALDWMCTSAGMVRLRGEGSGGTNGRNPAVSTLRYTGSGTFLTSRHLQVEHLRIETSTGATGLRLDRCNMDCWIDDVVVTGFSTYGIDLSSSTSQFSTTVSRVRSYANGWGIFVSANRVTIRGGEINSNTAGGILSDKSTQLTIADNAIESNGGPGVKFATHETQAPLVIGNYFEGNVGSQIHFDASGGAKSPVVFGNYLNGQGTTTYGIRCDWCRDGWFASNATLAHTYGATFPGTYSYRNVYIQSSPGSDTNAFESEAGLMASVKASGIAHPVTTFATLTGGAGTVVYCANCTESDPCAGSGAGAFAKRVNNRWDCN